MTKAAGRQPRTRGRIFGTGRRKNRSLARGSKKGEGGLRGGDHDVRVMTSQKNRTSKLVQSEGKKKKVEIIRESRGFVRVGEKTKAAHIGGETWGSYD